MRIILKRSGIFKCNWSTFDNRCGTDPKPEQTYKYACEVETGTGLDEHGFVIDQVAVNRIFQDMFYPEPHTARSCERIALKALDDISRLAVSNPAVDLYRITVGVGAIPPKGVVGDAMIYAEWKI